MQNIKNYNYKNTKGAMPMERIVGVLKYMKVVYSHQLGRISIQNSISKCTANQDAG